ncbi:unnamed protein product, partial [Symbiodinium necroappetens]
VWEPQAERVKKDAVAESQPRLKLVHCTINFIRGAQQLLGKSVSTNVSSRSADVAEKTSSRSSLVFGELTRSMDRLLEILKIWFRYNRNRYLLLSTEFQELELKSKSYDCGAGVTIHGWRQVAVAVGKQELGIAVGCGRGGELQMKESFPVETHFE